ncbi:MAG: tetrahydrofolate dehydrogenase/cyclohydrolase catalytic domain-containing protein, partial [Arenicellales bacterium]
MTAKLLSGVEVAEAVIADVRKRVEVMAERGIQPGLGTILVGDDGPSASYVRKKHEACESAGIR